MPLSEFYRLGNGKMESAQQKSTDISLIPDNEFVELVWENGQIMMQGQSSKSKKGPVSSNFQFHTPKLRDKETTSKNGKLPKFDSSTFSSDMAIPVPSIEMNLNRDNDDDDIVPWLSNYPVDDYCSELTSSSSRTGDLYPWSVASMPSLGSDLISSNMGHTPNPVSGPGSGPVQVGGLSHTKIQKQDSTAMLNFSHFLRPNRAANLHTVDKGLGATSSNFSKSPFVEENNGGINKETGSFSQLAAKPVEEQLESKIKNDKCTTTTTTTHKCGNDNEKSVEPIVASSSVCSGNSAERASNDLTNNLKRKSRDTEDSEWQSEDADEELVVKRTTARGGSGSKRSRAAEVHNLSERRRRDRINEKMRALQELIPNCNKVDKASMLDEAIEYLKTLQLQVQIMSMGAGLYMPHMMFPTGMQHMHAAAHMPHFSPMGLGMGMGMGMGLGLGMVDLNGASRGCPMIPVQGAPYPTPPGPANFHGGPTNQVFGHPGQVLPMTVSGSPMVPLPARPPINSTSKDLIQTPSQFEVTNDGFDHSTMLQKNDVAQDAVKSLNANETVPSRAAGSD